MQSLNVSRLAWWVVPLVMLALLAVNGPARSAAPHDPSTAPFPVMDTNDAAKSMVVKVRFDGRFTTQVVSTEVVDDRPNGRAGNPPLLGVRVLDAGAEQLEAFNEWHPLWAFETTADGAERLVKLPSAVGTFIVPFHRDAVTMTLRDIPRDRAVAAVDLRPAIAQYCQGNHDDPDCRVADLAVVSVAAENQPGLLVPGQSADVTIRTVLTNNGPTESMDARVTRVAASSDNLTVTPTQGADDENAVTKGEQRARRHAYSITCVEPGPGSVTFTSSVATTHSADVDPDASNNSKQTQVAVDCAVPVTVNVHPGGSPNSVNTLVPGNNIPLAVLTTAEGEYGNPAAVDATAIDPLSVRFGRRSTVLSGAGSRESHARGHLEDSYEKDEVTRDGDIDLVLHFSPTGSGLTAADGEGCLVGKMQSADGPLTVFGCDSVRAVR
jgi:hypothetical protein